MSNWLKRETRRLNKARTLLRPAIADAAGTWADLGCGDGIFTAVLYTILQAGSKIYAVDKNQRRLKVMERNLTGSFPQAAIHPVLADFTQPLTLPALDGLLIANALHFVRPKKPVLAQLIGLLKPKGRLIVVEYNTGRSTFAVPHPLDEHRFLTLAREAGLREAQIVTKVPSTYLGEMYTGMGLAT